MTSLAEAGAGRIHLLLHLPIKEENEDRWCLWRPDQAGFDSRSIFNGAIGEDYKDLSLSCHHFIRTLMSSTITRRCEKVNPKRKPSQRITFRLLPSHSSCTDSAVNTYFDVFTYIARLANFKNPYGLRRLKPTTWQPRSS